MKKWVFFPPVPGPAPLTLAGLVPKGVPTSVPTNVPTNVPTRVCPLIFVSDLSVKITGHTSVGTPPGSPWENYWAHVCGHGPEITGHTTRCAH